jgi:hypothetical protein
MRKRRCSGDIVPKKTIKKQTEPNKKPKKPQIRTIEHKKSLLKAMVKSLGNVTEACKETGLNRDSYYKYYNTDEKFKQTVRDIAEMRLDHVEKQLDKLIDDLDSKAITFFLKTKGKQRGYIERTEIDAQVQDNRLTGEHFAEAWKKAQAKDKPKKKIKNKELKK